MKDHTWDMVNDFEELSLIWRNNQETRETAKK